MNSPTNTAADHLRQLTLAQIVRAIEAGGHQHHPDDFTAAIYVRDFAPGVAVYRISYHDDNAAPGCDGIASGHVFVQHNLAGELIADW